MMMPLAVASEHRSSRLPAPMALKVHQPTRGGKPDVARRCAGGGALVGLADVHRLASYGCVGLTGLA
jgi:hypothetical protein